MVRVLRRLFQYPWWLPIILVNALFIPFTFYVEQDLPKEFWLRPMSLGNEQGLATWWSGIQLLLFALAIHRLSRVVRNVDRVAARGLLALSIVGVLLFWDELGSIHERARLFFGMGELSLLPLALLGGGILAYALWVLFKRQETFGQAWWRVLLPFIIFATVFVQEKAEHAIQWPQWLKGTRMVVEEGTELVGMFMLLSAAVYLMHKLSLIDGHRARLGDLFPTHESMAWFLKLCIVIALPLILLWCSYTIVELHPRRGHFVNTITVAAFFLAATIALRNSFAEFKHSRSWLMLSIVLLILSFDAECRFHHYLGRDEAIRLRPELGLLWGLPLFLLAAAFHPGLRTRRLMYAGLITMILIVLAIKTPDAILQQSLLQQSLPVVVSLFIFAQLLKLDFGRKYPLSTGIWSENDMPSSNTMTGDSTRNTQKKVNPEILTTTREAPTISTASESFGS